MLTIQKVKGKFSFKLFLGLLIFFSINSCENDIDIANDWKETAVVYGLLTPTPNNFPITQYIRIHKGFLSETQNALELSQEPDSLYFENLIVRVLEYKNGNFQKEVFFSEEFNIALEDGVFSSQNYRTYQAVMDVNFSSSTDNYSYQLIVENPKTGYTVKASVLSQSPALVFSPRLFTGASISILPDAGFVMTYEEGINAFAYDASIRMFYDEIIGTDTTLKNVEWKLFESKVTKNPKNKDFRDIIIDGKSFYDLLKQVIIAEEKTQRKARFLSIEFFGAGKDLYTYIDVNSPSISIVQKKPEYTNIENGLGIFDIRSITNYQQIDLTPKMQSTLANYSPIKDLNFVF